MRIESPQTPQNNCVRVGWKEATERVLAEHDHERLDDEWLDLPLVADEVFEWSVAIILVCLLYLSQKMGIFL